MKKSTVVFSLSFLIASPAFACQIYTFKAAAKQADVIFVGTPQEITNLPRRDGLKPSKTTFKVTRAIKGDVPETIAIFHRGNQCYDLAPFGAVTPTDKKYLIFAVKKTDGYETFHPLPNMSVDNAAALNFVDGSE